MSAGTGVGVILGTAAYMSPEQAKGSLVDHRSDLFSFGAVFYEILTGKQPFAGDSAPEVLASVLAREPDLTSLPPRASPRLRQLLRRCFEKTPKNRWQAAGDLRAELEAIAAAPWSTDEGVKGRRRLSAKEVALLLTGLALAAGAGAAAVAYLRPSAPPPSVTRFSLAPLPAGIQFNFGNASFDVSRDGRHITYSTSAGLYVRSMSEFDGNLIVPTTPDRKSTRLNSSHVSESRMPSSA